VNLNKESLLFRIVSVGEMTFSITTPSITTLSISTLNIMTLSIKYYYAV
jgi:hypothetical protein